MSSKEAESSGKQAEAPAPAPATAADFAEGDRVIVNNKAVGVRRGWSFLKPRSTSLHFVPCRGGERALGLPCAAYFVCGHGGCKCAQHLHEHTAVQSRCLVVPWPCFASDTSVCVCLCLPYLQTVAFLGTVDFAPGQWVGVVLDRPTGLIDGCVVNRKTNVRREYFSCKPNYVRQPPCVGGVCGATTHLSAPVVLCDYG